jgi:hypothetical protein
MSGDMALPGKKNMGTFSIYYFISGTYHILEALHVRRHDIAREEGHGSLFYIVIKPWYVPYHILEALHVWRHGFTREEGHGSLFYIVIYLGT